jgi:hypothetical protein
VTVEALALECIVRATEKLNVRHRVLAPDAVRLIMMELDEGPLVAAPPAPAHERAPTVVAQPDGASDAGREIAAPRSRTPADPRTVRNRVFPSSKVLDQQLERPLDDLRRVAAGNRMSEQVLGLA